MTTIRHLLVNPPTPFRVYLFGIFLVKNHFLSKKRSVFICLDNFLKITIFSKNSVFSFFAEAKKNNFLKKNLVSTFLANLSFKIIFLKAEINATLVTSTILVYSDDPFDFHHTNEISFIKRVVWKVLKLNSFKKLNSIS